MSFKKQIILIIIISSIIGYWGGNYYKDHFRPAPRSVYVQLQTEEPLHKGDTLMVYEVTKGKHCDTIWIGYLN